MLYLQAGVHFQEEKVALRSKQEFHRAGAHILAGLGRLYGGLAHALAQGFVHGRGGRFFHHFLVTPLHGAVALAQMDDVTVAITEYLDFHMPGLQDSAFQYQLVTAERVFGFLTGAFQLSADITGVGNHAHAPATATGTGLDHQRQADALRFLL